MEKPTRKQKRVAPSVPGTEPDSQKLLAKIAQMVRNRRKDAGWTLIEAAAWAGVGSRFLQDLEMAKPSMRIDQVLQVTTAFGLDVFAKPRDRQSCDLSSPAITYPLQVSAEKKSSPVWLSLHYAGLQIAERCGIRVAPYHLDTSTKSEQRVTVDFCANVHSHASKTLATCLGAAGEIESSAFNLFVKEPPDSFYEENNGPGLLDAIQYMRLNAYFPSAEIEQLIRWMILSIAIHDSEIHLGRWRVKKENNIIELAPLSAILCGSRFFQQTTHKGLKIGKNWADSHSRADQWIKFSDSIGIHPKTIFQFMKEIAAKVPGLLDQSLKEFYQGQMPPAALVPVMREIRTSCQRMSDLQMMAARSVSGLKTINQPKIEVLKPIYKVPAVAKAPMESDH